MAKINKNYNNLAGSYLFSEIAKRTRAFLEKNPGVEILKLGIGNTTEALAPTIIKSLQNAVQKLSDVKTYTGYGDEQGNTALREAVAKWYSQRAVTLEPQHIFISDGAKSDSANISTIFAQDSVVAITDPVYPVYLDSNIINGKKVVFLNCSAEDNFFPKLPNQKVDLIFLCSPNNPTGAAATRAQLKQFVDYCLKNNAILIFDAAYSEFITDPKLPKSIYQIPGAKKCAIEIQSFSKMAGFTGVRLGWSVVPMQPFNSLWNRRQTTMFNGASNLAQEAGLAALSEKGQKECQQTIKYYMENAKLIKDAMEGLGLKVYGGVNAPYIWLKTPNNLTSWEFFDQLLSQAHVVGTPGSGFGSQGEGYFRLSAFGHRENVIKAINSIKKNLKI